MVNINAPEPVLDLDQLALHTVQRMNILLSREKKPTWVMLLKWKVQYENDVASWAAAPKGVLPNYGRRMSDRPAKYPGWYGRIWYFLTDTSGTWGCSLTAGTLIHCGTGGYGLYSIEGLNDDIGYDRNTKHHYYKDQYIYPMSFDVRFFLDDLKEMRTSLLLNETPVPARHEVTYERDHAGAVSCGRYKFDREKVPYFTTTLESSNLCPSVSRN